MLAPVAELSEYTGVTQGAAIVRRMIKLGAPATLNAARVPAVPAEWWERFKAGQIAAAATPASNDAPAALGVNVDGIRRIGRGQNP